MNNWYLAESHYSKSVCLWTWNRGVHLFCDLFKEMSAFDDISQLELLLAAENSDDEEKSNSSKKSEFLANVQPIIKTSTSTISNYANKKESIATGHCVSLVHNGDTDSSDDEDKRNLETKYDTYGADIKRILDAKEEDKRDILFQYENKLQVCDVLNTCDSQLNFVNRLREANTSKKISATVPEKSIIKPSFCTNTSQNKIDVYTDPVFGIRIVKPLISNATLLDRMQGRQTVKFWSLKRHAQYGDLSVDWVVGGVIVRKSDTKESQKGSQFSIWTLSDLKDDLKTMSLFLFKTAHKTLWKTSQGTVIGVLNPSVLDKKDNSKDEATLSVDNPDKILIIGQSKDLGYCKSRKKNGSICNAFVSISQGEACIYHIKQEYQKYAKRSELQSPTMGRGLVNLHNKVLGKDTYIYGGKSYSAIPAVKNKVLQKDKNRLMSLDMYFKKTENEHLIINKAPVGNNPLKTTYSKTEFSRKTKDSERLELLGSTSNSKNEIQTGSTNRNSNILESIPNINSKLLQNSSNAPKIGLGLTLGCTIDLDLSYSKKQSDRAKENALKWIKRNGPLQQNDPHNIKGTEGGKKRALQQLLANDENKPKKLKTDNVPNTDTKLILKTDRFKKMLEASSVHADLVKEYEDSEKDKYFSKLEKKEAMEEKMMNTYKVPCKAVRCVRCKYTSFSASDKCKEERHPLQVFDAFKRFFKCADCGNRTVSLDLVPLHSCKNCRSSKWERTGMMREKKAVMTESLSIRGEEEKFIGSLQAGGNINLLVPDT